MEFLKKTIFVSVSYIVLLSCTNKTEVTSSSASSENSDSFLGRFEGTDLSGKACSLNLTKLSGDLDVSLDFGIEFEDIKLPKSFSGVSRGDFLFSSDTPRYYQVMERMSEVVDNAGPNDEDHVVEFSVLFAGLPPFLGNSAQVGFNVETGRPLYALASSNYHLRKQANLCVFPKSLRPLVKSPLKPKVFDTAGMLGSRSGKDLNGKACSLKIDGVMGGDASGLSFELSINGAEVPRFLGIPRGSFEVQSKSPEFKKVQSKLSELGGVVGQENKKTMDYSVLFGPLSYNPLFGPYSAKSVGSIGNSVRLGVDRVTGLPLFAVVSVQYPTKQFANICVFD